MKTVLWRNTLSHSRTLHFDHILTMHTEEQAGQNEQLNVSLEKHKEGFVVQISTFSVELLQGSGRGGSESRTEIKAACTIKQTG